MINHETTLKKPWKPTKNHDKPWNHLEKPWKPTKNHDKPWNHLETMETNQNHEKPWIYLEKTRKPQTGLLGKWSFFVTHTQTLHHNIYIVIILTMIIEIFTFWHVVECDISRRRGNHDPNCPPRTVIVANIVIYIKVFRRTLKKMQDNLHFPCQYYPYAYMNSNGYR